MNDRRRLRSKSPHFYRKNSKYFGNFSRRERFADHPKDGSDDRKTDFRSNGHGFSKYNQKRRFTTNHDERNRREKRSEKELEKDKSLLILNDPTTVPTHSIYFNHDRRTDYRPQNETITRHPKRKLNSLDHLPEDDEETMIADRVEPRKQTRGYEERIEYPGYKIPAFLQNKRSNKDAYRQKDSKKFDNFLNGNRKRSASPDVWKHDLFEKMEKNS